MRRLRRRRSRQEDWEDESASPDEDQALSALDQLSDEDLYGTYDDAPIEPFVPVEDDDFDVYEYAAGAETASPARESSRRGRFSWPRLSLSPTASGSGSAFRWDYLLLALLLIGGGIFGALLNQDRLQAQIEEWWPLAVVGVAALWMIIALVRRQIASFLGGAALAGVGLSLLMNNQDIAGFKETVLGMVLVTAGLGIVIRGFVLRQRAPLG
jgi:hypothetical protein